MIYCLNPNCHNPQNPSGARFCQTCGSKLWLKNRYQAIKPIGAGSFGRTFLAEDCDRLKAKCLIKQFSPPPSIYTNPEKIIKATELFEREARQLLQLGEHPQIPTLYAYFEEDKQLYLVEEFIDGEDLGQDLGKGNGKNRGNSEAEIRHLLQSLLPVLQYIHSRGVIHRDIKPANILRRRKNKSLPSSALACRALSPVQTGTKVKFASLLPASGQLWGKSQAVETEAAELVLIDFGVCKQLTGSNVSEKGSRVGTEGYAPLEQWRGGKAYPASDIYSLGVTCIQLLVGTSLEELYDPFEGRWVWRDRLQAIGKNVSPQLGQILDKMLKDRVSDRYQKAEEVLKDLNSGTLSFSRQQLATNFKIHIPSPQLLSLPNTTNTNGAEWRCVQTLVGHLGEVNSLAISPGSHILASGSWDNTIKVWQLANGKLIHTLKGHLGYVTSIAISPDGYFLASGSWDKTIKVWHLGSGRLLHTLKGHSGYVNSVAISPNGEILVSGSWDKTIKIWHLERGELLGTLVAPDCVRSLAISPDGKTLVSGSDERTVRVWQLDVGALPDSPLYSLSGHSHCVRAVAISSDGKLLASGSWDSTIKLWHFDKSGRASVSPLDTLSGHSCYVYSVAFSPDCKLLASGSRDSTIKLWYLDACNSQPIVPIQTLTAHSGPVYAVAFSPDRMILVSGSDDATIKVWRCD